MKQSGNTKKPQTQRINRRQFLASTAAGATTIAALQAVSGVEAQPAARPAITVPSASAVAADLGTAPRNATALAGSPASDFMVDVIRSLDIEYVATNPGNSFEGLHESLINYGNNRMPEILTCLHEESAVAMAHGYAKIEGKPMLALLAGSVGLLHGSMAIYNAYADRVPVFIMVGNHKEPRGGVYGVHSAEDMGALVRDYVKWDADTTSVNWFAESAARAYKIAMTPPMGPVMLMIDHAMQMQPLDGSSEYRVPGLTRAEPPQGNSNAVREAARLLVQAERPLIISQRCARNQEGMDLLVELAEILQLPVRGGDRMDFPRRHPLYGNGGPDYKADLILGLEVNDMYPITRMARATGAKTISISSIELSHGSNLHDYGAYAETDLIIAADAQTTLPALIEEVKRQIPRPARTGFRQRGDAIKQAHGRQHARDIELASKGWNARPVSTARLSAELWNQIKHDDWSLVSWQGFISGWPDKLWNFDKHYRYIGSHGAAGIGYNAPASVGAALANKKHGRLSINIQGDGDLNYAPGVLWTAAHHRIPLLTVMHNNRGYQAEVMYVQEVAGMRNRGEDRAHIGTTLRNPDIDYAKIAQGYGMYAEGPIENPEDLGPAIKRALARVRAGEPALLDVVMQPR